MKKAIVILTLIVAGISAAVLYQREASRRKHIRLEQQAAELMWKEFLTQYQKDIPLGTSRSEVKRYLEDHKDPYREGKEIEVKLGETPDPGAVCDRWDVYASFQFSETGDASPQDHLTGISLTRVGHCL